MKKKLLLVIIGLSLLMLAGEQGVLLCQEETANKEEAVGNEVRDPFVSLLPRKEVVYGPNDIDVQVGRVNLPAFSVQGLVWGVEKPQAIIDNKIYGIGDEVSGARIVSIEKSGIKVNYQDNVFLIAPGSVKITSKNQ